MEYFNTNNEDVPFESHFVEVFGSKMHYYDEGEGDPIVFLHGIPASNYLWRNVIPHAKKSGRCIAPDLIGLGKSDKPDIEYSTQDHIRYFEGFIEALGLQKFTLVMHDWGSVVGLDYAMRHEEMIKSVVVLEGHIRAEADWDMLSLPVKQIMADIKTFISSKTVDAMAAARYFFDKIFPNTVLKKLSPREMLGYGSGVDRPEAARPLLQYLNEIPLGKTKNAATELIERYSKRLEESEIPKLMFYAIPGFNTTVDTLTWAKKHLKNLVQIDLGDGLHDLPETHPEMVGAKIAEWHSAIES